MIAAVLSDPDSVYVITRLDLEYLRGTHGAANSHGALQSRRIAYFDKADSPNSYSPVLCVGCSSDAVAARLVAAQLASRVMASAEGLPGSAL